MSQTPIYDQLMSEFNTRRRALAMSRLIELPTTPSQGIQGVRPVTAIMDEATLVERFVVQLDKPTKTEAKKAADVKTLAGASYGSPSLE
jgi:hypothetical protein